MFEGAIDQFHFLRPVWLVLIPIAIWLHFRLRRGVLLSASWNDVIAPHLLKHLAVIGKDTKRIKPYQFLTIAFVLATIALAGPTWQRQITPFTQDKAPLIIALKLTPTMLAIDQAPTRLERAKQKIRDLLERRKGARTAVIAYAGSAHAVLPLTDDAELIELYLSSLVPALMPVEGDNAEAALALADKILQSEEAAGTILFMSDGIDRTLAPSFAEHLTSSQDQILFLAFGSETGGPIAETGSGSNTFGLVEGNAPGVDIDGIRAVAKAAGGSVVSATPDPSDVNALSGQITSHLVDKLQQDENLQWRDFGYVLLWPLAFLILLWARRGWTVYWV